MCQDGRHNLTIIRTQALAFTKASGRLALYYGMKGVFLQGIWSNHNRGHPSLNLNRIYKYD